MELGEMQPYGSWLIVERDVSPDTTDSGLLIPEKAKDNCCEVTVVKIGLPALVEEIVPGDRLVIGQFDGIDMEVGLGKGEERRSITMIQPDAVVCKLETKEARNDPQAPQEEIQTCFDEAEAQEAQEASGEAEEEEASI